MYKFDEVAQNTINNLCKEFDKSYVVYPDIISKFSIGVELEIKFKYLFPELHEKYFLNIDAFNALTDEERSVINKEIGDAEKFILERFNKTIECGIPKGLDKYWEFSFTPVYNLALIIHQVDILIQTGLIPEGKHSFHITIGGAEIKPEMYWNLLILELLFCDKERIASGFSVYDGRNAAWAKKGEGGILIKNQFDLVEETQGVEFRTLYLDTNKNNLPLLLIALKDLLNNEFDLIETVKLEVMSLGLPDRNWRRPNTQLKIWKKYIENFDNLSNFTKTLYHDKKIN